VLWLLLIDLVSTQISAPAQGSARLIGGYFGFMDATQARMDRLPVYSGIQPGAEI
jgi:hypothetical protein